MTRRRVKIDGKEAGYADAVPPDPRASSPDGKIDEPWMALIAHIMDNLFRVPGTKLRFGIDPLIGLFPGVGDGAGAVVSLLLIGMSARHGVPRIVLVRMALNVILNTVGGLLPFGGDLFSFVFKSNARNYALFRQHSGPRRASTTGDWIFVGGLCAAVLGVVFCILFTVFMMVRWLFSGWA